LEFLRITGSRDDFAAYRFIINLLGYLQQNPGIRI
jgi:hypothetical protein